MKLYYILIMLIPINQAHSRLKVSPEKIIVTYMSALEPSYNNTFLQELLIKPIDNLSWGQIQIMAQQDNINAQVFIALCFIKGYHVIKDEKKGFTLLEKIASRENSTEILYILASESLYNDEKKIAGLKLLKQIADKGHLKAQELFVIRYLWSAQYRNPEQFLYWAKLAAGQGSLFAIGVLRNEYAKGTFVQKDIQKAIYLGEVSIKLTNSHEDMNALARIYSLYGNDNEKFLYWAQKAEKQKRRKEEKQKMAGSK